MTTTAYFLIARRNHKWMILGILKLSDEQALEWFEREAREPERLRVDRIRPADWGVQKALAKA